jgi:hypothetical protein
MRLFFTALLWLSLYSLVLSGVTALSYEIYAATTGQVPLISNIIIPWVKSHNLWASLIVGAIAFLFAFLFTHFFGARINVRQSIP